MTLPVAFLTDYGYEDAYAGSVKLVIERLEPGTTIIDLTHGIPLGDIRRGALALQSAVLQAAPAVYLGVVDPGVGTERRAVALHSADGSVFVGPDNGLFELATASLGGVTTAFDISATPLRLDPVSPTFHGRDVFAPVAAHLAAGRPLEATGEPAQASTLVSLALPEPRTDGEDLVATVLYADGFGNLILNAAANDAVSDEARLTVTTPDGRAHPMARARVFADADGGLALYVASQGRLAIGLDRGSAADELGVGRDAELRISPWR